jgi:hypothetical protein
VTTRVFQGPGGQGWGPAIARAPHSSVGAVGSFTRSRRQSDLVARELGPRDRQARRARRLRVGAPSLDAVSVPVGLDQLRDAIEGFDRDPYLLTVDPDGRPRSVSVSVRWRMHELVMTPGARTRRNAAERPLVSLVWPPASPDGYTLIVDARVERHDDGTDASELLVVRPTSGVLHRPAGVTTDPPTSCGADCVPVLGNEPEASPERARPD